MFKKGSKLYSIFKFRCPSCHEGNFYVDNNPYHLKKLSHMHTNCNNCNIKYEIEPSFFHGAMYVSYGLTIAFSVAVFIICYMLGLNLVFSSIAILVLLILVAPITFKLSRIIYANMFIDFKSKS